MCSLTTSSRWAARRADHTERPAPFFVGQMLVYPNIGDPVMKTTTKDLPFFFTIYRGESGPLTATAQLLRDGGVVAEAPLEIAASTEPRIQQLARLPVSGLAPGTYQAAHHRRQRPAACRRVGIFHAAGLIRGTGAAGAPGSDASSCREVTLLILRN